MLSCELDCLEEAVSHQPHDGRGQRQLVPAFVGTDRSETIWSETMFLYCLM